MRFRNALLVAVIAAVLVAFAIGSAGSAPPASAPSIYQAAQATAGGKDYDANCAACHGSQLEGGAGPALRGTNLRKLAKNSHLLVGDMFAFVALQMPLNEPASLTHKQYVEIMAYILKKNGYPAGSTALTYDGAMKSKVVVTSYK